jgi:hypothetical protein
VKFHRISLAKTPGNVKANWGMRGDCLWGWERTWGGPLTYIGKNLVFVLGFRVDLNREMSGPGVKGCFRVSEWANGSVSGQGGGLNMGRRVKERCFRVSE